MIQILPLKSVWWEEEEVRAWVVASLEVVVVVEAVGEGVVLEGLLMDVAVTGLDHPARTTRGQTPVLMAPHQPGDSNIIPDVKRCLYVE